MSQMKATMESQVKTESVAAKKPPPPPGLPMPSTSKATLPVATTSRPPPSMPTTSKPQTMPTPSTSKSPTASSTPSTSRPTPPSTLPPPFRPSQIRQNPARRDSSANQGRRESRARFDGGCGITSRCYGKYKCRCHNDWSSVNAWWSYGQFCKRCHMLVVVDEATLRPLIRDGQARRGYRGPRLAPHESPLCEKCIEIQQLCTNFVHTPANPPPRPFPAGAGLRRDGVDYAAAASGSRRRSSANSNQSSGNEPANGTEAQDQGEEGTEREEKESDEANAVNSAVRVKSDNIEAECFDVKGENEAGQTEEPEGSKESKETKENNGSIENEATNGK